YCNRVGKFRFSSRLSACFIEVAMPEEQPDPARQAKPRRVIAPVVALLVTTGAGHFAVGAYRRGVLWFVLDAGAVLLGLFGILFISPSMFWFALGAVVLLRIASVGDVLRLPAADPDRLPGWGKTVLLWIGLVVIRQIGAVPIRAGLLEAFRIPAGSMSPTL